jgi:broad specificity phosphatase PhoE
MNNRHCTVLFVRHGNATHNRDAELYGESAYFDILNMDASLTEKGRSQARDISGLLGSSENYNRIYCSPLRRCWQTLLEAMPDSKDTKVFLDDRLMEPQGVAVCNKRQGRETILASVPDMWSIDRVSEENPFDYAVDEGYDLLVEGGPKDSFMTRVGLFMLDLIHTATLESHQRILVVAHHDWILTCFKIMNGRESNDVSLQNCGTAEWTFLRKNFSE